MDELLDKLKLRIQTLLEKQNRLQQAEQYSQHKHSLLISEKKLLQEKHQLAITQIEKMIARLKLLEKSQL